MAQNTNLNVTPYYDDFDKSKNFYRVLYRPGFPIQARELTTSQSILQNQVENIGGHLFKDGAMVIPGQIGYDLNVDCIMLQESFLGAEVENYRSQLNGLIIEGLTSGVRAKVLYSISATDSDKGYITIYVKYIESGGTKNDQGTFSNNEQLITEKEITFGTTLIEIGSPFAQLLPTAALQTGSVAYVQTGVYFIRGFFVDVPYQYILLDQYGNTPSYRVGLDIQESIITPEDDLSLNDNAAGTSNYAAPGAHRFRITTKLNKKLLTDDADKDFIELLRINGSKVEKIVDRSAYDELEKSLALRTYEESGDYVVSDFQITMRENLSDGFNNGVYTAGQTTSGGATAAENLYSVELSPGLAYVRGYRIKTLSPTYVDLEKPRDTDNVENKIVPFELGNWARVNNIYGFPNLTGSTVTNSYQVIELRDTYSGTPGDQQGNLIGYARTAAIEHIEDPDNTFGNADDKYKLNVFDVQMFTLVTLSSAKSVDQGSILVGGTSGARGFIVNTVSSNDDWILYQVEGEFIKGEMLQLNGEAVDTIADVHPYKFSDTRQVLTRDESSSAVEFTADLILEDIIRLEGDSFTYDATGGSEKITGLNSNFAIDLRPGDRVYFSSTKYVDIDKVTPGSLNTTGMASIFNYAAQTANVTPGAGGAAPTAGEYTVLVRYRGRLQGLDNADLFSPMPKKYIKSISDESSIVRRTFDAQTVASNSVSITLPENEQFVALDQEHYNITVLASSTSSLVGDPLAINTTTSGAIAYCTFTTSDRTTLQIDNLTNITSVKVTATISKNVTTKKTKSQKEMFVLKCNKTIRSLDKPQYGLTFSTLYGTRIQDKDLSLGLVDCYRLHAVYESLDDNDAVVPSVTIVEPVFFATNTIVTGRTSQARAKVVEFASASLKLSLVYLGDNQFIPGETITGEDSSGNALTGIINDGASSVVKGSKVITDNYYLEVGQTGFIYDTSRLVRKKGVSTPIRQIKIVCDFYQHSATGDYFGGQSYLNTLYKNIPFFHTAFLADYLDWRPGAKNLYSDAGTISTPAYVNCSTFDFKSRVFTIGGTTNSTIFDIPKLDSDFRCDFDWYLPRTDKIFLLPSGEFQVVKGKSSSEPQDPDSLKDGMHLATLKHRPYGFGDPGDTVIKRSDNRRYTMRDIGALERRLDQVEYYTSLNMLETDTFNTTIVDSTGKDRFKNGFIVDDFSDHSKSETSHEDFGASLDFREGICRASHYTTNVALILNETLSTNYQVTGPLITLPYAELKIIDQPYASRVENVNPFNVFTYIGRIDLSPASDDWIDTDRIPERVIPTEGDFQNVSSEMGVDQNGMLPIEWGSWQTNWGGTEEVISSRTVHNQHWIAEDIGRSPHPQVWGGRGMRRINRVTTIRVNAGQSREGIRTRVVPRIDRVSQGDRIVSTTSIPWVRSRNLAMNVVRMKPRTQFFTFFDGTKIDGYVMPKIIELVKDPSVDARTNSTPFVIGETVTGATSGVRFKVAAPNDKFEYNPYDDTLTATSYASTTAYLNIDITSLAEQAVGDYYGNMQVGEILTGASGAKAVVKDRRVLSDRLGQFSGSFFIPNPGIDTNPRWATGSRTLRFTTSDSDSRLAGAVDSSAETEYAATGTLNTVQENILAVRNAEIVRDTVTEERVINTTRTETRQIGWYDPLAQSFICDEEGGVYLTSVDIFFNSKDTNIPISMQIRTMENGYPTKTILPFSDTTLNPADVQLSEVGAVATKFKFRAPVYIPQSQEHCFVLLSDSNSYQVWISRMGELDITGDRTISEQPYAGVLFKSQNASTWTADQYEDLKFSIYRANFDNTGNTQVTLNNAKLGVGNKGVLALRRDPIETFQPSIRLVLNSTTLPYTVGARVYQKTTLAEGTITKVETLTAGVAITLDNISGTFAQGSAAGGNVTNRIVSSKTTGAMTVTGASGAFTVGETITGNSSGAPTAVVGTWTDNGGGAATFALTSVSDDFTNSTEVITGGSSGKTATVNVFTPAGDAVETGAISDSYPDVTPTFTTDQRKIKVYHTNHAMHDVANNVTLSGLISEISDTYLTAAISASDSSITVNDASAFHKTINGVAISASNVGFLKIDDEILSYSAISNDGKTVTIQARAQGSTTAASHVDESIVSCYNLDGIPLTELNKTHSAIQNPTLDSYEIAVTSLGDIGIRGGGANASATQNLQYENIIPQIQRMILPKTSITARGNFISGTSINDGASALSGSFANDGIFLDILLQNNNQLTSPKLICSQINESEELSGEKSLRLDLTLKTTETNVSPIIDTDRMSAVLVSNRINNPSDTNSAKLSVGDTHEAAYITRAATLTNSSGAIKLLFAAFRPTNAIIRVLYRVRPTGNTDPIEKFGFEFFPTTNQNVPGTTDNYVFKDYSYEVSGLSFDQYQIKIVYASPNQAYSPIIKDLRAIALAV